MASRTSTVLAPPTLSNTKLHMIQTHEAGEVYNRFLGIHIHHRDSFKLFLQAYEVLGGCSGVFTDYEPVNPYVGGSLADRFVLPTRLSIDEEV